MNNANDRLVRANGAKYTLSYESSYIPTKSSVASLIDNDKFSVVLSLLLLSSSICNESIFYSSQSVELV